MTWQTGDELKLRCKCQYVVTVEKVPQVGEKVQEEKKDAIKQTDMLLSNDDLDLISGGKQEDFHKKYCLLHGWYDSYECPQCAAESQD